MFSNECRPLKRKLSSTPQNKYSDDSNNFIDTSSTFMTALSPAAKQRTTNRMAVTKSPQDIVRQFHLDRKKIGLKPKNNLQQQVQEYLHSDVVSIVTPDLKKAKKGIQYRLASLQELHQRFQVDESAAECSYSQFTHYVPENILNPKPEDWGTCLCMTCLNPELKLESIKRQLETNVTLDMVKDNTYKQEVNDLIQHWDFPKKK